MTPLDLLVRVSIVLAAAWTLAALLRWRSAALRHWVLAAGIFGAGVAPAVALLAPSWHLPGRATATAAPAASPLFVQATIDSSAASQPPIVAAPRPATLAAGSRTAGIAAMVISIWLGGAALALLVLATGLARLAWIGAHAEPLADARWNAIYDELASAYGISRQAALLQTDRPLVVTWGVRSPRILVPRGAADWPCDRIRVVLAHELAHIARADWLLQMTAELVRAMHWCNPLAWIVCRRARLESEHACDDAVLNLGISGSDYASHLLDLARSMHMRRTAWVPAQAIVRPSSLERRVAAMLNARLNRAPVSRAGRVAATAALLLITTLAAGFSAAQGASLTGVVTDQLGHPIANTSLSLLDLTSNANHQVKADQNGRYEFTDLSSGDYMLTVETLGFKKVEERVVLTDASLQRDVQLQLGTVHETITVIDGPSMPMPEAKRAFIQKKENAAPQPCPTGGGCIVPPTKLTDKKPVFPDSQAGVGGVVTLTGIIDATGHVSNLQVAGTANPDLAQAAIAAVTQWEFLPTRLDGQVVDTQIQISVAFKSTK